MNFTKKSLLAGMCIAIGGAAFLSLDNKLIGSFLFSIGLLTICALKFNLFTGRVCYLGESIEFYQIIVIWIANFIGSVIIGIITRLSNPQLIQVAQDVCDKKLAEGVRVIPLGIMCNILIFFAVYGYKNIKHEIGKYLIVIMCVIVFIMSGYEHCIANMYYFTVAGYIAIPTSFAYIVLNSMSNAIGGICIYRLMKSTVEVNV